MNISQIRQKNSVDDPTGCTTLTGKYRNGIKVTERSYSNKKQKASLTVMPDVKSHWQA